MLKVCLTANTAWNIAHFRLNHARALQQRGIEVHAIGPPDHTVERLTSAGLIYHPWHVDRPSLNPVKGLQSVHDLWKLYREIQPDLVHHYTVKAVLYGTMAARACGVKGIVNAITGLPYLIVSDKRGLPARTARSLAMRWYAWALTGSNTRAIFQNQDDLNIMKSFSPKVGQTAAMTNGSGVDLESFAFQPLPKNPVPRILFVGRLIREKGILELLEAARILRSRGQPFRLTLCGAVDPGNRSCTTQGDLEKWCAEGLVDSPGSVEDVRPYLREADVVVLPSWREGTPRSLLEAAAFGRPIVATDVPGCREVVQSEANGLLVPVRSPIELADALQRLLEDAALRERMGREGRRRAETLFDERLVIEQNLEIYRELLGTAWPADTRSPPAATVELRLRQKTVSNSHGC